MSSGTKYTAEFRADAVRMVVEHSKPVREVAEASGVRPDTLRTWCARARREGLPMVEEKPSYEELEVEVHKLRAEVKAQAGEVKTQARDLADERKRVLFLGKAVSFFAAENYDQQNGSK